MFFTTFSNIWMNLTKIYSFHYFTPARTLLVHSLNSFSFFYLLESFPVSFEMRFLFCIPTYPTLSFKWVQFGTRINELKRSYGSGLYGRVVNSWPQTMQTNHSTLTTVPATTTASLPIQNAHQHQQQQAPFVIARHQIIYHPQYKLKKPQNYDDCRDYRRLLVQLEETERRFDEFWKTHHNRLRQCLELRRFEQNFRELQVNWNLYH